MFQLNFLESTGGITMFKIKPFFKNMKKHFYVEQQENRSSQAMQATGAHNQIIAWPLL